MVGEAASSGDRIIHVTLPIADSATRRVGPSRSGSSLRSSAIGARSPQWRSTWRCLEGKALEEREVDD